MINKDKFEKLAKDRDLRFPNISLNILSGYNTEEKMSQVEMFTFVYNVDKSRLTPVWKKFKIRTSDNIFDFLKDAREHFHKECIISIRDGLFNTLTSIEEPHIF